MTKTDITKADVTYTYRMVELDKLHPNPDNPRVEAGDIGDMVASIRKHGILQDLLVRPDAAREAGHYVIEAGFVRWTAAAHAGLDAVPCKIKHVRGRGYTPQDVTEDALIVGLVENIHRKNLNAMEKARALGRLRDEKGWTVKELAAEIGQSAANVSDHLILLELNEKTQQKIASGKLSPKLGREAVQRTRALQRKRRGQKPVEVGWEPDHFTRSHPLARKAETMCDARGHTSRRRLGRKSGFSGACGQCWETVIRQDEAVVQRTMLLNACYDVPLATSDSKVSIPPVPFTGNNAK